MGKSSTTFTDGHRSYAFKDETGKKYGKLTVIERVENSKFGTARWKCKCDCGNIIDVNAQSLRSGTSKSCGCLLQEYNINKRSGDAVYMKLYQSIKTHSLKKNIPFNLTLDDIKIITKNKCTYCGREPYIEKAAYNRMRYSKGVEFDEIEIINGIDKLIPELGYVKDNCVSCCKYCNRAKSDLLPEEFKQLITLIYDNHVK